ncbi:MAG: DNA polymerase III subunit delta [Myxococcales bacterium]|nr:DNA polymerase III subunit delta [Myxococcales bacterium]
MTPDALREELASGTLRPAYLVVGSEPLLRDDAVAALRKATVGDGPADFNFDRLDGANTTPAALMDVIRSLPVMAPRRLVVLRDPEPRRGAAKALPEAIAEAVGQLEADGETVLVVVAEKVDGRSRWVKAFGANARVDCDPPKRSRELVNFVKAEAKRQEVSLVSGAAELLAERVGPHLLMLRHEITKASLLAGLGKQVTRDHVAASTSDIAEEPIWDLTDAIGEGRGAEALGTLGKLLSAGAAPPAVLGSLVSHFRRLLRLRSGGNVPGPPFVQRKLDSQASRYTERRLIACLQAIHQTDLALKGAGGLRPELALERLVIGLVG